MSAVIYDTDYYARKIRDQLVSVYGFKKQEDGSVHTVDGTYPMYIDNQLDLVLFKNEVMYHHNFIKQKDGVKKFAKLLKSLS